MSLNTLSRLKGIETSLIIYHYSFKRFLALNTLSRLKGIETFFGEILLGIIF